MNGRVYDPDLGRFLSPDPYVQMPDFSQNFNRYSYVLNNPLKYTDPSGEFWWIIAGAVIGGAINVATHWDQIDNFGEGLAAFGIGAAAGGLAVATGGAALTAYGGVTAAGFVGGAVAGGIGYTSNTLVQSIGNGIAFGDAPPTINQFTAGLGISMLTGGAISGTQAAMNGNNFWSGQSQAFGRSPFSFNNTPTAPPPGRIEAGPVQGLKNVQGPSSNLPQTLRNPNLPNNEIVKMAGMEANNSVPGAGRFVGTARHQYATELVNKYQSVYGNRGLMPNYRFNNGVGNKGILDIYSPRTNTIYDWKFGYPNMTPQQFLNTPQMIKYHNNFNSPSIIIFKF